MADCRFLLSWLALGLVCVHVGAGFIPMAMPFKLPLFYKKMPAAPANNYPDLSGMAALFHEATKGSRQGPQPQHHRRQQRTVYVDNRQLRPSVVVVPSIENSLSAPTVVQGDFEDSIVLTSGGIRGPLGIVNGQITPVGAFGGIGASLSDTIGAGNAPTHNFNDADIYIAGNQQDIGGASLGQQYVYDAASHGGGGAGFGSASARAAGDINFSTGGSIDDSKIILNNNAATSLQDGLGSLSGALVGGRGNTNVDIGGGVDDTTFYIDNGASASLTG